ncbi:MAG: GMC family oxidoreductase [Deltaproteobacteria bacterium]|nr:GMC family oxidoreductase [Deltaproteobacteria bacterium]
MRPELVERILEFGAVTGSRNEEVDAVVVGSGCGGAVVAKELAGAGWSVLVLERGGLYLAERGDFDQREDDMMAKLGAGRGLDTTVDGGTAVLAGNNVGGASVHYWADSHRLPRDRCELFAREHGVQHRSYDELVPWFERIERDLNIHEAPDELRNRNNWLFLEGAQRIGLEVERVRQARKNCVRSGYCMQGCAYDAKQSQLVTYVPEALARGARLFADCEVERVLVEGGRAVGAQARFLDRRSCEPSGHTLTVKAKRAVVVAAGGFSTAPLLMASGIADRSGQLGKNLQMNPGMRTLGIFDEDVVQWRNIPAAVGCLQHRLARYDEQGRYLEGGFLLYPDQLQPASLAACLPGYGEGHRALMELAPKIGAVTSWIDERFAGTVTLGDDGLPLWDFPIVGEDADKFRHAITLHARILLAAGAREVIVPDRTLRRVDGRWVVGARIKDDREIDAVVAQVDLSPGSIFYAAPHPAGAARMGGSPDTSVLNSDGEVWSTPGLYVADPSAFPTVVSVDPSESIMAWSYVTATRMLEKRG